MPRIRKTLRDTQEAVRRTPTERTADDIALMSHYRATFGTDSGQIVLADLLGKCGLLLASPNDETEGARKVARYIIEQITRDPRDLLRFQLTTETGALFNERDTSDANAVG